MGNAGGLRRRNRGNLRRDQTRGTRTVETSAGKTVGPWKSLRGRGKNVGAAVGRLRSVRETGRGTGAGGTGSTQEATAGKKIIKGTDMRFRLEKEKLFVSSNATGIFRARRIYRRLS